MNAVISGLLSEVKSGYTSPPFDEVEKLLEGFIKNVAELLENEDPELVANLASTIQKIIEAKNDFMYAKIMKEKPEGGTPFTNAIEKEKEEREVAKQPTPALASRAQAKRPSETVFQRDKE